MDILSVKFWFTSLCCVLFISYQGIQHPVQEDCSNGIDDDDDGLIDLNDPDCDCPIIEPISFIPNPSFEEMECCPDNRSQLRCASNWIQASEATTDYLHTCGWMGWPDLPPPLPFPDGNAVVGFRNGRFGQSSVPGWKEYSGACLLSPLKARSRYRFRFNIGFTHSANSPPTNVVFFGSNDCANLPFGVGDSNFGCPTNGPGWIRLGSVRVAGQNNWITTQIDVVPSQDIYAIAIGPDCDNLDASVSIYYFFDNLILADIQSFEFTITPKGHLCSPDLQLSLPVYDTLEYQWYRDGIALVGQTSPNLKVGGIEGKYQVKIIDGEECRITPAYIFQKPVSYGHVSKRICAGERLEFNKESLDRSGIYADTLKTADGCDSILLLALQVDVDLEDTVKAKIFEGDYIRIGTNKYSHEGRHLASLPSAIGCDSLVHLFLEFYNVFVPNAFTPNGDGINDSFTLFSDSDIRTIRSLKIFDRWGGIVFSRDNFLPGETAFGWNGDVNNQQAPGGIYIYSADLIMEDGQDEQLNGSFVLIR